MQRGGGGLIRRVGGLYLTPRGAMSSPLLSLPRELTLLLLEYLDPPSLAALESTARSVKEAMGERWKGPALKKVAYAYYPSKTTVLHVLRLMKEEIKQGSNRFMFHVLTIEDDLTVFKYCACECYYEVNTAFCERHDFWVCICAAVETDNSSPEIKRERLLLEKLDSQERFDLITRQIRRLKQWRLEDLECELARVQKELEHFKSKVM